MGQPVKYADLVNGMKLQVGEGFRCLTPGAVVPVQGRKGYSYVTCVQGRHYLDANVAGDGTLTGFTLVD